MQSFRMRQAYEFWYGIIYKRLHKKRRGKGRRGREKRRKRAGEGAVWTVAVAGGIECMPDL